MRCLVVLLSVWLVAGAEAESKCEKLFKKVTDLREKTKPDEKVSKEEWEVVRGKAMTKAIKWLEDCLKIEKESEHHVKALRMIADTYSDKGEHNTALETLTRVSPADETMEHNYVKSKILKKAGKVKDAVQLLGTSMLNLTLQDPPEDSWSDLRTRVAHASLNLTYGELLAFDGYASMVLSELANAALETHDHEAYYETLRVAVINSPYNTQLRRFVIQSHANGDLQTLWRCYAMPPNVAYDLDTFQKTLFAFLSNLPTFITHSTKNLASGDSATRDGLALLVEKECGHKVLLGSDFVTYAAMQEVTAKCLDKTGIVADWHRIAQELNTTLDEVLNTDGKEAEGFTPGHLLAMLGEQVIAVTSRNLTTPAAHDLTPAHILPLATGSIPNLNNSHLKDAWGRKPQKPCWATRCRADISLFAPALQTVVDSYTPSAEWGYIVPDEKALKDMSEEERQWVPRWEDRKDYDATFDTRLSEEAPMDIDYVKVDKATLVKKYLSVGRPVVMHDCLPGTEEARKRSKDLFDFKQLVRNLGGVTLPFGDHMHLSNPPSGQASLVAFSVEQLRLGKRTLLQAPMRGPFKALVDVPAALEDIFTEAVKNESAYTLRVGGSGSGRSMHFDDSHTVDFLAEGHRVWLLLPPPKAYYSTLPAMEAFVAEVLSSSLGAFEVQQLPGDAVYIPPGWSALFVNLRNSIGWAGTFAWGASLPTHTEPPPAAEPEKPKKHSRGGSVTMKVNNEKASEL